jgi:uncharacterized protein YlaI
VCGSNKIRYTNNKEIYGKTYGNGGCYLCDNCKSYVGVHNTKQKIPLGRFANKELRELKMKCHNIFDKFWKEEKLSRGDCYRYLANKLNLYVRETHFGWFDKEYLLKSLDILNKTKKEDILKYIKEK